MNLQVVKVSGKTTGTTDQKVHNILISKIGQKIKKKDGGFWFH